MTYSIGKRAVRSGCLLLSPLVCLGAQLTIAWDDNSTSELGFKVERSTDAVNFAEVAQVGADVVTFVDRQVISAATYSYRVAAYDATRTSGYSNVITGSTPAEATPPVITAQPAASQTVLAGSGAKLSVEVTGIPAPSLQWKKNGVSISGATTTTLSLPALMASDAGTYAVVATNSAGIVTSRNAVVAVSTPSVIPVVPTSPSSSSNVTNPSASSMTSPVASAPTISVQLIGSANSTSLDNKSTPNAVTGAGENPLLPTLLPTLSRLVNLSVRSVPGPEERALLVGFVVKGGSKSMLVRAVGPGLKTYTDGTIFNDPAVELYHGSDLVARNDNWGGTDTMKSTFARLGAFPLPDGSKDAAVLASFSPQNYTASVTGIGTGLAMAEIYDADRADGNSTGRLVNISARAYAGPGDGVLIIGFVISGHDALRVLVRAVGPSLISQGVSKVLADPQLELYRGNTLVQRNDNWAGGGELITAFGQVGAFMLPDGNSKDSAMVVSLAPGAYTVVVSGVKGTEGVALAEVYELH